MPLRSSVLALAATGALLSAAGCAEAERVARSAGDIAGNLAGTVQASWDQTATEHRAQIGQRYAFLCSASGVPHTVWGTDVYTDDSSVCTAGVHAGAITLAQGGRVVIEMRAGQESYRGSSRRAVTTLDYGSWPGAFVVVNGAQP